MCLMCVHSSSCHSLCTRLNVVHFAHFIAQGLKGLLTCPSLLRRPCQSLRNALCSLHKKRHLKPCSLNCKCTTFQTTLCIRVYHRLPHDRLPHDRLPSTSSLSTRHFQPRLSFYLSMRLCTFVSLDVWMSIYHWMSMYHVCAMRPRIRLPSHSYR